MREPNRRAVNKLRRAEHETLLDGIRHTQSTLEGRRFIWWLFERTNLLNNAFSADERVTSFTLGEQNIGLQLLALLEEANPEAWLQIRQEQVALQKAVNEMESGDG